jgi:hypothetical protein
MADARGNALSYSGLEQGPLRRQLRCGSPIAAAAAGPLQAGGSRRFTRPNDRKGCAIWPLGLFQLRRCSTFSLRPSHVKSRSIRGGRRNMVCRSFLSAVVLQLRWTSATAYRWAIIGSDLMIFRANPAARASSSADAILIYLSPKALLAARLMDASTRCRLTSKKVID